MFRATMCPSSGEITVSMRHLGLMPLCMDDCLVCILDSHTYRVTSPKCRIDAVISPDDGHIVARNMLRKEINILRKMCTKLALFTRLYRVARSTKQKMRVLRSVKAPRMENWELGSPWPPLTDVMVSRGNVKHTHTHTHNFLNSIIHKIVLYLVTRTKSPSFCMTTFSASLRNLTAPLHQSHDCSCCVSRLILAPPPL
jgi:hypothetical protein